jgi:hypothetical protein
MRGRALKLSASRRLVGDLMWFSISVPRVTVQRRMNIGPLLLARNALPTLPARPSWTVIFLKGYALLAEQIPDLRRAYVKLPWPQLYEYPVSIASLAYEREYEGERAVLLSRIKDPEHLSIEQLDAWVRQTRTEPVSKIKDFRRALRIARVPLLLRRPLMWLGLNIGRQRANYFGTFQLSVYSGLGAESLNPLTPLTTLFNYGSIGEDGSVTVRIHYDHRVLDGANVARALVNFEEILNGAVADEVKGLARGQPLQAGGGRAGSAP